MPEAKPTETQTPATSSVPAIPADTDFEAAFRQIANAHDDGKETPAVAAATPSDGEGEDADLGGDAADLAAAAAAGETPAADGSGTSKDSAPGGGDASAGKGRKKSDEIWADVPKDIADRLRPEYNARGREIHRLRTGKDLLADLPAEVAAKLKPLFDERDQEIARLQNRKPKSGAAGATAVAPKPPEPPKAPADPFKADKTLQEFETQYPEIAKPLKAALAHTNTAVANADQQRYETAQAAFVAGQEAALAERFNDWQKIVLSTEFGEWTLKAPDYIKDGLRANGKAIVDATFCGDAIERYMRETGKNVGTGNEPPPASDKNNTDKGGKDEPSPADRMRSRQLAAATSPTGSTVGAGAGPPEDFDAAFSYAASASEQKRKREIGSRNF